MSDEATARRACPYLHPPTEGPGGEFLYSVYCRRPDGRVRVPSRDQLKRFCTSGHHVDCLGYRRISFGEAFAMERV
jgi:hypothetical protein